jgi:transposase
VTLQVQRVQQADATLATAYRLRQDFAVMVRADLDAVRAGLTETWSNGPTEGFVHKFKLLKRQGYGRDSFDLLRQRVLAA